MKIEEVIREDLLLLAEYIDKEIEMVNWELEYGLTDDKMKEIKEQVYKKLVK